MGPFRLIFLSTLSLTFLSGGSGARGRVRNRGPIDKIQAHNNFNLQQFTGVWRLFAVGSQCSHLKTNNHRLEAVSVRVSDQTEAMRINTFRKLDGICWDIKQDYKKATTPGRFSRKNRGQTTEIVISETDYTNYAIVFFQQRRKITVKLYGRTSNINDTVKKKFRELVINNNIPEIFIYVFPQYGFCETADEFHRLVDCIQCSQHVLHNIGEVKAEEVITQLEDKEVSRRGCNQTGVEDRRREDRQEDQRQEAQQTSSPRGKEQQQEAQQEEARQRDTSSSSGKTQETQTQRREEEGHKHRYRHRRRRPRSSQRNKRANTLTWHIFTALAKARIRRTLGESEGSAFGAIEANEESCQLTPDTGPCFEMVNKFFYNHSSMACEHFIYGGCLGNANKFNSEQKCLQTCRTPAACRLPIETGSCRMYIELWAFDSVNGKCVKFTYGGCEGNGNKFYTQKECLEYCDPIPEGEDELLVPSRQS
ncbi:protein AMBP-like [Narcine bancroftii]|uniref:protein AMBP-like n=1 Tax=Narcine bancroftii TaxID=1343680 RepID=UPI0038311F8E